MAEFLKNFREGIYPTLRPWDNVGILYHDGTATVLRTIGALTAHIGTGGALSLVIDNNGQGVNLLSANTLGAVAVIFQNIVNFSRSQRPFIFIKFQLKQLTNQRFFVGITDSAVLGSMSGDDTPAHGFMGIRFFTTLGDTTFHLFSRPSSASLNLRSVDTTIVPDVNQSYLLTMDDDGEKCIVSLLKADTLELVYRNTFEEDLIPITTKVGIRILLENRLAGQTKSFNNYGASGFFLRV